MGSRGRAALGSAAAVLAFALALASPAGALTFEVNVVSDQSDITTADGVCDAFGNAGMQCTLRAAIQQANASLGDDTISFNIPTTLDGTDPGDDGVADGVLTIAPAAKYPIITGPVNINGFTQFGATGNTADFGKPLDADLRVEIRGNGIAGLGNDALELGSGAGGSTVFGLVINRFSGTAIVVNSGAPTRIAGNYIGTDPSGDAVLSNLGGIFNNANGTEVGGANPETANLIAGNGFGGIGGNGVMSVIGNYVGVKANGKTVVGNGLGTAVTVSNVNGSVAGSNIVARNIIAGATASTTSSLGNAIDVLNPGSGTAFITQNRIFENEDFGIDLGGGDGVTPNDKPDADGRTNFPVIQSALRKRGKTKLIGRLTSFPDTLFSIEFFQADGKSRQGKTFLREKLVTTDADGEALIKLNLTKPGKGKYLVTTATDTTQGSDGDTSEFSKPKKVK